MLFRRNIGGVNQVGLLKLTKRKLQIPICQGLLALMDVKHAGIVSRLGGAQLVFGVGGVTAGGSLVVNESRVIVLECVGLLGSRLAIKQLPSKGASILYDAKVSLRAGYANSHRV